LYANIICDIPETDDIIKIQGLVMKIFVIVWTQHTKKTYAQFNLANLKRDGWIIRGASVIMMIILWCTFVFDITKEFLVELNNYKFLKEDSVK
jgi:hypothetical protein